MLTAKRRESHDMVSKLEKMIVRLCAKWKGRVRFAFQWPKDCAGWKDFSLKPIPKALSYSTTFDGCAYGLRSVKNGKLIRKPWRVVTDYFLLTQEINTARLVLVIMVIRPVKAATRSSRARTPCD